MSLETPILEGSPLATAAEVQELREQLAELRRLLDPTRIDDDQAEDWRTALRQAQIGFASLSPEARALYEEALAEARRHPESDA